MGAAPMPHRAGERPLRARADAGRGTAAPAPRTRRPVHGVLLLDKPLGWTSNDALQKAKGLLGALKAGHTGTLDPLATGLLPLCFGAATKFSQVSLDADKRYRATVRLGQRTATGDREGAVVEEHAVTCSREAVAGACARFVGRIEQRPPMHSALKHEGRALYDYARAGIEVERPTRAVEIRAIELVDWQPPELVIDIACSKGTYVRTLAEDIGSALGCGAHLAALQRTGSGVLELATAHTLEAIAARDPDERLALLLPVDALLAAWPAVELDDEQAGRFLTGLRRRVALPDAPAVRVYRHAPLAPQRPAGRAFLGSAHIHGGELIPDRLLSPLEVQAATA